MDQSEGESFDRSMHEEQKQMMFSSDNRNPYWKFANYFVDDKENLKDIMQ